MRVMCVAHSILFVRGKHAGILLLLIMLPNTGLTTKDVGRKVLFVCGEDAEDLTCALDSLGVRHALVKRYREFQTYTISTDSLEATMCLTGLGSASVEVGLTELYLCGARQFVHSGTCGSLSGLVPNGSVVVVDEAESHDGASFHYNPGDPLRPANPDYLKKTKSILLNNGIAFTTGRMISTDTFYCMGAAPDGSGGIRRPGLPLKAELDPPEKFIILKNMLERKMPFLIDMEAAAFYAVCSAVDDNVFYISIKGVANRVPFIEGEQVENTGVCLCNAVEASLCILSTI